MLNNPQILRRSFPYYRWNNFILSAQWDWLGTVMRSADSALHTPQFYLAMEITAGSIVWENSFSTRFGRRRACSRQAQLRTDFAGRQHDVCGGPLTRPAPDVRYTMMQYRQADWKSEQEIPENIQKTHKIIQKQFAYCKLEICFSVGLVREVAADCNEVREAPALISTMTKGTRPIIVPRK